MAITRQAPVDPGQAAATVRGTAAAHAAATDGSGGHVGTSLSATSPGPSSRGERWRPVLWVLGGLSAAAVVGAALSLTRQNQVDLHVYVAGASRLLSGSLYSVRTPGSGLWFTYPPVSALLFLPLSIVPLVWARVLWALVNVASLYLVVMLSLGAARPTLARGTVVQWSLILMAPSFLLDPVRFTFGYGQINLLLAAAVLADLSRPGPDGPLGLPRGLLTGIAASLKLTPLIFVPLLVCTRQWRPAMVSLVTFAACGVSMFALTPGQSRAFWTSDLENTRRIGRAFSFNNQSVAGVLDRWSHRPVSGAVVLLVAVAVGVAGVGLAVWAHRSSSPFLGLLVCAVTGLMISPITWTHHLVWVIPVLAWLVLADDRPRWGRLWAAAAFALFWWAPNWYSWSRGPGPLREGGMQLVGGSGLFLGMVVFQLGVFGMLVLRRHRRVGAVPSVQPAGAHSRVVAGATGVRADLRISAPSAT